MPTIVKHYDKKTGKTRVYESTPHYDPVTKQSRPKRKYWGTLDPETGELIPSSGRRGRTASSKNATTTMDVTKEIAALQKTISEKATAEIVKLKDRILGYQEQVASLRNSVKRLKQSKDSARKQYKESLAEKDAIIKELQNRLAHAEALLNHDGSNTGTPTSQTPINKDKVIPNSRRSTGKPKGGQTGHPKASLKEPDESEIKYEYDIQIKIVKVKHEFYYYECNNCGTVFRSQIPPNLKEKVQYGSNLQAFALSLTNTVNAAMNKTAMFLTGITGGDLTPCEGYIAKLQSRAAKGLLQFREDLKLILITRRIIYWDDTVIFILMARACFRFYGDETIAYYTAHAHKDMESLDDDNVLNLLPSDTKAMHDHCTVNYNDKCIYFGEL